LWFVCTNLAVGGGGVFAGGFVAVHVSVRSQSRR
jgi:hypothetical protein